MHKKTVDAFNTTPKNRTTDASTLRCPVPHATPSAPPASWMSVPHAERNGPTQVAIPPVAAKSPQLHVPRLQPSQKPAANQTYALPTSRRESTIPKEQAMATGNTRRTADVQRHALFFLKATLIPISRLSVHGVCARHSERVPGRKIVGWEQRCGRGLWKGLSDLQARRAHVEEELNRHWDGGSEDAPTLFGFRADPRI